MAPKFCVILKTVRFFGTVVVINVVSIDLLGAGTRQGWQHAQHSVWNQAPAVSFSDDL
jgi:hypothetical protein